MISAEISRELVAGASFPGPSVGMRMISPVELASRGTGVSSVGFILRPRSRRVYGGPASLLLASDQSDLSALSTESSLSGVPAWSPPVL
ncbi:hypothetical protein DFJ64_0893 [Thermasporomyces composti]|uniref:Uncharacterized protein n=1 Tax=Thermasporomyces composti TaxID=696763 RepID=A0A3D9V139_THECX|nr:hypothetical protein DFJ64_0893 [Thermasporomyces composti]